MASDRLVTGSALQAFHLVPRVFDLPEHRPDLAGGEHPLERCHVWALQIGQDRLLGEIAQVSAPQDRAGTRGGISDESADEGRLAGPVPPHQSDLVPWLHAEGRVLEKEARA